MKKSGVILTILFFVCITYDIAALLVGSDTTVSVESFVSFPEIPGMNPNEIVSFAWMKNGFDLESSATQLLFRSIYPVSGTVDFNGGIVTLGTDLIFQNVTTLNGLGAIIADGHRVVMSSSIASLPADTQSFQNADLFFDGNIAVDTGVTFTGDCTISGANNLVTLGTNGALIVESASTLHIKDVNIMGLNGEKIRCVDDTATIILENMRWIQDGFFTFTIGAILFDDQVDFSGTGTFFYESSMTSTIAINSHWKLSNELTLKMGRCPFTLTDPIYFTDETSFLTLDNVDFLATDSGICITRGTIVFDRSVHLDAISTGTERGMVLGDGNPDNDIRIRLNPGCSVIHNSGYWTYNNGKPDRFESNSHSASLVRNEGSEIAVHQDLIMPKQTVEVVSALVSPIEVSSGVTLSYKDTRIVLPTVEFELTGDQLSAFSYELNGNDEMFFTKGSMPLAVSVTGAGNTIKGNGGIDGSVIVTDSAADVSLDINGQLRSSLTLNNGTLTLLSLLDMDNSGVIIGPGNVNLSIHEISLSSHVESWQTPIFWNATGGVIKLQAELDLLDTWTVAGELLLEGNGNILHLKDNGKIFLQSNAHLIMKDIIIQGVGSENIHCVDDTCRVSFFEARWLLDNDLTVSHGSISFERSNSIGGPYTLTFDQLFTNTIKVNSDFTLDSGITFSLGRTSDGVEPIYFENDSAQLVFDDATLGIKNTGITLSRGIVTIDKQCAFDFNSTSTANGLQLGNGVAVDDIAINLNSGASIALGGGHILQNITDIEKGFVGPSTTSKLIIATGLVTHYQGDGKLANMTIDITPPTTVTFDPGINVFLENTLVNIPTATILITARRFAPLVLALEGDPDGIEIVSGIYPQPLVISGTGNTLKGIGTMAGLITFLASSAELIFDMSAVLTAVPTINNGTITLSSSLQLGNGISLTGPGIVNLGSSNIELGETALTWATPIRWIGDAGSVGMHGNIDLTSTWTFEGHCVLKGHNNTLRMDEGSGIYITPGSSLCFENIKLENVSQDSIVLQSDDSTIIFDDIIVDIDAAISFTTGALRVHNNATFTGGGVFAYESSQTSTIEAESRLKFDSNFTFSYYPSSESPDLIVLDQTSSILFLRGADLFFGIGGLNLTKGLMRVRNQSSIWGETEKLADGSETNVGLSLGNNSASLDCILDIEGSSQLNVLHGALNYKNVSNNSLIFGNENSRLRLVQDTRLRVEQFLSLSPGNLALERGAHIHKSNEAIVTGSVFVQ